MPGSSYEEPDPGQYEPVPQQIHGTGGIRRYDSAVAWFTLRHDEDRATTRRRRRGTHEPPWMAVRGESRARALQKMRAGLQGVFTPEHPCRSPRRRKMIIEKD